MQLSDSVVSGDTTIHTGDVHNTTVVQQPPSTLGWVNLGLVVVAIILASVGIMTDAWVVQEETVTVEIFGIETTVSGETETGLDDFSSTSCIGDECEMMTDDLGDAHDNCTADIATTSAAPHAART